jgi:hypothetical protein
LAVVGIGLLPAAAGARAAGDPTITLLTPGQGA